MMKWAWKGVEKGCRNCHKILRYPYSGYDKPDRSAYLECPPQMFSSATDKYADCPLLQWVVAAPEISENHGIPKYPLEACKCEGILAWGNAFAREVGDDWLLNRQGEPQITVLSQEKLSAFFSERYACLLQATFRTPVFFDGVGC
ncbi:MAG: hypothetical protein ACKVZH_05635 [Blastocatellia bacterium]